MEDEIDPNEDGGITLELPLEESSPDGGTEAPSVGTLIEIMQGMGARMGQLEAAANQGAQRAQRLEDNALSTQQQPQATDKQEINDVQLDAMVEAGTISTEQRTNFQRLQSENRILAHVDQQLDSRDQQGRAEQQQVSIIAQYKQFIPDIMESNSQNRALFNREVQTLVSLDGAPTNVVGQLRMERQALRNAFGPPEGLQRISELPNPAAASREVGGGGTEKSPADGARDAGGIGVKLNADQKHHYQRQIDSGLYKDWDEVAKLESEYGSNGSKRVGAGRTTH